MKDEVFGLLKAGNPVLLHSIKDALPALAQTPEELKILKNVYVRDPYGYFLLNGLKKKLPEPEIREMVNRAWDEALKKQDPVHQMTMRAQDAVQEGQNVEALKFLLKKLLLSAQTRFPVRDIAIFLSARCDFPIYDQARLREWYDKNADRIVFDPATGKYVVKK